MGRVEQKAKGSIPSWESFHRLVHGKKVSAWRAWMIAIAYMRRMELIVERAARRLKYRHLNASYASWVDLVYENKLNRLTEKGYRHDENRVVGAAYKTWAVKVKTAIIHKRKAAAALRKMTIENRL